MSKHYSNINAEILHIMNKVNDPNHTLDLRDLKAKDHLFVKVGNNEKDFLDFEITEPANPSKELYTKALLPGFQLSSKCENEKINVMILGTGSFNSESPFKVLILTPHQITVSRCLTIFEDKSEGEMNECIVFKKPVQEIISLCKI